LKNLIITVCILLFILNFQYVLHISGCQHDLNHFLLYQNLERLMTSLYRLRDLVCVMYQLLWLKGHHDGCRMRSKKRLPFQSTWFHLWFS